MLDPLADFPWSRLNDDYDSLCDSFPNWAANGLDSYYPNASSDRALYSSLIEKFAGRSAEVSLSTYKAMLYWKLYSTKRQGIADFCKKIDHAAVGESTKLELTRILENLPPVLPKNVDEIIQVLTGLTKNLYGMAWSCAIPVRTTFLHFVYPNVVPIFDKKVLQAVGVKEPEANHSYEFLREYIPHAWSLAEKYRNRFTMFGKETPIRIIDMALWVSGAGNRRKTR